MATKISDLTAQVNLATDDVMHLRTSGGIDKKITGDNIKKDFEIRDVGFIDIQMTNLSNASAPQILAGSRVAVNGTLVRFTSNPTIDNWTSITNGSVCYIKVTAAGAVSYTETAPSWNQTNKGYYDGNDRYVAILYKGSSTLYLHKTIIKEEVKWGLGSLLGRLTQDGSPVIDAELGDPVTLSMAVNAGEPILTVHQHYGNGANYGWRSIVPWTTVSGGSGNDYEGTGFYIGSDFYVYLKTYVPTTTWQYRLDIFEHNWLDTAFTLRGTGFSFGSESSDKPHFVGGGFLRNVDSNTIEFCVVLSAADTTSWRHIWTFRFNKTTYVVSQVGSQWQLPEYIYPGSLGSYFRTFPDDSERVYGYYNPGNTGNTWFRVFQSNQDGTYTQLGSGLQFSNRGVGSGSGLPVKIGNEWFFGTQIYTVQHQINFFKYNESTHVKTAIADGIGVVEPLGVSTSYYNFGLDVPWDQVTPGADFYTWRCRGQMAGYNSFYLLFSNAESSTDAASGVLFMQRFKYDTNTQKIISTSRPIAIQSAHGYTTVGRNNVVFLLHNNIILFNGFLSIQVDATAYFEEHLFAWYTNNHDLSGVWRKGIVEPGGEGYFMGSSPDPLFDGRYYLPKNENTPGPWKIALYYFPKLLGFADRDYSSGDIVRPVISGKIRGLSSMPRGATISWDLAKGELDYYSSNPIEVGKVLTDSVIKVDTPIGDLGHVCIDER